jgi:N,N'-diacetyllegionaminate synthase
MVAGIRNVESALGDGVKQASRSELKNRDVVRRSIVATRHIAIWETFTPENLTVKRPGTGVSPMRWDSVIGTPAPRAFDPDEPIDL